jgi:hypothetical protein
MQENKDMKKTKIRVATQAPVPALQAKVLGRILGGLVLVACSALAADVLRIFPTQVPLQTYSPFTITGFIQKATLATTGDPFSGGTVTVNGVVVTIPRNTIAEMPALALTWGELFSQAPMPYTGSGQSGLALSDNPAPLATYEITVIGNRVIQLGVDKYIAGLVAISQQSVNTTQGYINSIDYVNGELWVGSTLAAKTGARVRINDPVGRYGIAHSPDVRFTADTQNPTISAQTGFPMCIPRTDPTVANDALCPQRNRPVDPILNAYQTMYTMPAPGAGLQATDPDATQQTPFEVGDFITFMGTLVKDPSCGATVSNNCEYIAAHTIVANLGIFTAPGAMPVYLRIEQSVLGVAGQANPLFPQEAVDKLTLVAYTTDSTSLVDIYALDVDACGKQSDRFYNTTDPTGPPFAGVKGRAKIMTAFGNYLPPTRELRVSSRTFTNGFNVDVVLPTAKTYANGLLAGQYHSPIQRYILPENLAIGSPSVPLPFQVFPFLTDGIGPYAGAVVSSVQSLGHLGQLSPWPGPVTPAALGCGPSGVLAAPTANSGQAQSVVQGATVILDGSLSFDPNVPPLPLSYTWAQTGGPALALQDAGRQKAYFTAPAMKAGSASIPYTFALVVSDGFSSSMAVSTTVTVKAK